MACSRYVTRPGQMIGMFTILFKVNEDMGRFESEASVLYTSTALYLHVRNSTAQVHTLFSLAFFLSGSSGSPTGGLGRPCMLQRFFPTGVLCAPTSAPIRSRRKVQAGAQFKRDNVVLMAQIEMAKRQYISQSGSSSSAIIERKFPHHSRAHRCVGAAASYLL